MPYVRRVHHLRRGAEPDESCNLSSSEPSLGVLQRRDNLGPRGGHFSLLEACRPELFSSNPAGPLAQASILGLPAGRTCFGWFNRPHLVSPGQFPHVGSL